MRTIIERLAELFDPQRMLDYAVGKLIPDLIVAAATFLAFWLLWRVARRAVGAVLKRTGVDVTARAFLQTALKYIIITIGAVTALAQLGVDTTSILTSVGVAGLTLGFAARDSLSNIISGLFIFWDRPFVVDDLIEIGDHYGRVQEITMRTTRVVTPDGRMLAVPNSQVVNSLVASYTNFPHLRVDIDVTVGTSEDLGRVRRLLLGIIGDDRRFMADPPPEVVVAALNDFNVALQLRVWIVDERDNVVLRFELREQVFETLRSAGVDMPSETLRLEPLTVRSA